MNDGLTVGDRIWLHGDYDMEPKWLGSEEGYFGRVIFFIPGQNETPAAVVRLEKPIAELTKYAIREGCTSITY
ncbi:MAG: hypothetical protein ACXADB_08185 [Candidatus Hermodarchaeia archaeon]|jgi:hypothetical protein